MKKLIKRLLQYIISGTFTLFITACYGMPAGFSWSEKKITTVDRDNNPIPGLQLTNSASGGVTYTDAEGIGEIIIPAVREIIVPADADTASEIEILIEDVDGPENGGEFSSKTLTITDEADYLVEMEERP